MDHDDFQTEPVPGLPEVPPEGERILWQGAPDWWALSKEALKVNWVAGYFILLASWRFVDLVQVQTFWAALQASVPLLILGALACGLLILIAVVQARYTVYTITNKRVAMRIGAALTVTLNLPYRWIGAADLDLRKGGTGTIAMQLIGDTRLSYLVCWPHVRPWHMNPAQPALRCIPNVQEVAELLSQAAQARLIEAEPGAGPAVPVPAE